jgi:two-component system cell cycle sensor histidine kinase/response regulator CckA
MGEERGAESGSLEALRESEERLRLAVTAANLGTWHWNLRTGELIWSDECMAIFGFPPGPMSYQRFASAVYEGDRDRVAIALRNAIATGDPLTQRSEYDIEYRHVWPDGSVRWCSAKGRAYYDDQGNPLRMEGTAQDITPRKRAERALEASEKRFRDLAEGMPHMLWQLDAEGRLIYANRGWARYFGREEIELFQWQEVVHPDDLERILSAWPEMAAGELNLAPFRLRRHDGTYRWHSCRSVPTRDETGKLLHIIGISTDVDDLKRAKQALQNSEAQLKTALRAAGMGTWVWELDSERMFWDESVFQLFGLSAVADTATTMRDLIELAIPEDRPRIQRALEIAVSGSTDFDVEYRVARHGDGFMSIAAKGRIEVDTNSRTRRMFGACMDVTQHKRLEEELRQAQKMEAIGQLAGGIAHDFNNLLTIILGQTSIAQFTPGVPARVLESIRDINDAAERAASLTAQLLAFGRRQVMTAKDLVLEDVVLGIISMLERVLGEHIALSFQPAGQHTQVYGDPNMLSQVLLNLAINARDAMPSGGKLCIRTHPVQFSASSERATADGHSGDFVCLSVADTGTGIPDEVLPRIFEPFFTTKDVGKGTGLGLATVYGIVKQHGGWVSVHSDQGSGTTFEIYLPRVTALSQEVTVRADKAEAYGRGELILLVEDEPIVRNVLQTVLEDHGYRLLSASRSSEALELWNVWSQRVDLLLTDLVMPESLNGYELATKLQAERPGLRTVVCSGHSAGNMAERVAALPFTVFLQKPTRPETLLAAIRQLLERSAGASSQHQAC